MQRVTEVRRNGMWSGATVDTVVLTYQDRHRRRLAMSGANGLAFLLDLPRPMRLRDGDALQLEDGRLIRVKAATEPLLEISCPDEEQLVRVAWHLGNRHLPTQISGHRLRIADDHVIAEMARGLGAAVRRVEAPFDPEGGAYGHGDIAGHGHNHEHDAHSHG